MQINGGHDAFWQVVHDAVKGDADAFAFLQGAVHSLHCWDDLIDRDQPVAPETINRTMWWVLVELPRNRFYQAHAADFTTLFANAIQNWHAANAMEATPEVADKQIAFILRSEYCNLVTHSAALIGGYDWARQVTPTIRRMWHDEGFEGYLLALAREKAERT
jgi:hypothetical protein